MATLLNSRNEFLKSAATRILGAGVYITSGVANAFTIPANGTTALPGLLTLTAVPSRYVSPQYTWLRRFGDTGDFTVIAGETTPVLNVAGDAAFVASAGTSGIVQYRVDVIESGTLGANPSTFTLTVPILRQGVNSVVGVLTNESQTVSADVDGVVTAGTIIQSTLVIYNGISDDSANWTASIQSSAGITASLINGKTISVSLPVNTANGYVDITAVRQGYQNITKRFSITKVNEGDAGANGNPGANTALVYAYQRSATAPATNPGIVEYSFSTNTITTTTLANSWLKSIPSGTLPLYVTVATASSAATTDTIAAAKWSAPVLLVQNGADGANGTNGLNSATVFLYARNDLTTAPTLATTGSATYTFSTRVLSGTIPAGWTSTIPAEANGSVIWVAQATASSTATTDTIANTEWSAPQVLAKKGDAGANGISPISYEVLVNAPIIARSTSNILSPTTVIVSAFSTTGTTKTAYSGRFKIYEDSVLKYTSAADLTTYTYTPTTFNISLLKVELYLAGGTTTLLDTQEIPVVVAGSSGMTLSVSNGSHLIPADNSGAVATYTGSGTTIQVFEGSTALTYLTTLGTTASAFTIGTPTLSVASSITVGARSGSGTTTATVAQHSSMSNSVDSVVISYPITYNRANGAQATQTVTQSITKAKAGTLGIRGSRQVYSTDAAYTSTYDFDGSGAVAAGGASYAAKATALIATVTAGSTPTTPINGDTVTFSNGSNYVYTITHNGTSWVPPGTIIDGSLLVTGSITTSKLKAGGVEILDSAGNVILSAGSSLGEQVATTYGGGNLCQNSGFDSGTLDKWTTHLPSGHAVGIDISADWKPFGGHAAFTVQTSGSAYSEIQSYNIPVKAGQRYEYHGKTGAHRCNVAVFIYWFNSANNVVSNTSLIYNLQEAAGGPSLNTWKHHGGFGVAPAGAVAARFIFRKDTTAGGYTDSYMFATQAYFGEAGADQTTFTPWAPSVGGGRFGALDQITPGNASTYIASAAIGSAQIGSLALTGVGNFSVKSATAGARMEMDSRVIKIFDASGNLRVQIGDLTL